MNVDGGILCMFLCYGVDNSAMDYVMMQPLFALLSHQRLDNGHAHLDVWGNTSTRPRATAYNCKIQRWPKTRTLKTVLNVNATGESGTAILSLSFLCLLIDKKSSSFHVDIH